MRSNIYNIALDRALAAGMSRPVAEAIAKANANEERVLNATQKPDAWGNAA